MAFSFFFFIFSAKAEGEIPIYRSVGTEATDALDTGSGDSNELTISGSIATFSLAVPDNVGVGDAIQYDSDDDGSMDAIAFIHGRTDSTHYTIIKAAGASPSDMATADTDWSIFRAYTSLVNAENGTENTSIDDAVENFDTWSGGKDLVAANEQWNIACYANGITADETAVSITGWTTDVDSYIKIFSGSDNEASKSGWDNTRYHLEVTDEHALRIRENYVRVSGLQISAVYSSVTDRSGILIDSISAGGSEININSCRIKATPGSTERYNTLMIGDSDANVNLYNSIVTDGRGPIRNGAGTLNVYNTTLYGGSSWGVLLASGSISTFKNCAVFNTPNDFSIAGTATIDYVASDDGDGTNPISPLGGDWNNEFTDPGNGDFTLLTAGNLVDAGVYDPGSGLFNNDIDGETRSGLWDIGADEGGDNSDVTPPSTVTDLAISSCSTNSCDLTWTAPGDDADVDTATAYDLRYSTSAISNDTDYNNATQVTGEPAPGIAATTEFIEVAGLSPETTYYFALKTLDELPNTSDLSNVVSDSTDSSGTVYTVCSSGCTSTTFSNLFSSIDLDPGDIVEARADTPGGSKTFYETVTPGSDDYGSEDNPLIIRARSGDTITIDGGDTRNYAFYVTGDYITIEGFSVDNTLRSAIYARFGTGVTIDNCSVNLGEVPEQSPAQNGILGSEVTNFVVKNNIITTDLAAWNRQNDGIACGRCTAPTIHNNTITLRNTREAPTRNDCIETWGSSDLTITNNYCTQPGCTISIGGLQLEGEEGVDLGTWTIMNNYIKGHFGSTLFVSEKTGGTVDVVAYNNTAISTNTTPCKIHITNGVINGFRNNVCYNATGSSDTCLSIPDKAVVTPANIGNNLYHDDAGGTSRVYMNGSYYGWSAWQATGSDIHGLNTDPVLNPDGTPMSNSPVIDNGEDLSHYFTTDVTGTPRPQGSAWDIGAFELVGGY